MNFNERIIRLPLLITFCFLSAVQHTHAQGISIFGEQKFFNGHLENVTRVTFKAESVFSKKNKGEFVMTGEHEWTETAKSGIFHWQEMFRSGGIINLVDSSGERYILNLNNKVIDKKLKFGQVSLFMIVDIEESTPTNPDASHPVQPIVHENPATNSDTINSNAVFYAILISENTYQDRSFSSLPATSKDIQMMYELLTVKYTFDPAHTDTMTDPSKAAVLERISAVSEKLKENDNLLIFFSGYGWIKKSNDDSTGKEGFLVPNDAVKGGESSLISNNDISNIIKRSGAGHILVVADAEFTGPGSSAPAGKESPSPAEAYKMKSRELLASGNDHSMPGASEFAQDFTFTLEDNPLKYIAVEDIINGFKKDYSDKTKKEVQYIAMPDTDDHGGRFIFIRR